MDEPLYESPWSGNKEWWVLNPGPFIDIAFNLGIENFVFTEKVFRFAPNMRLSPAKLLEASSRGRPWRAILVEADYGEHQIAQVAVEYTSESWFEAPVGVYSIWSGREPVEELYHKIERLRHPGEPIGRFFGDTIDMTVIRGQDQRILIKNPPMAHAAWNDFFTAVSRSKRENPDVIYHMHGGKNISRGLGTGVDAFDHPVRTRWIDGLPTVLLPNGRELTYSNQHDKEIKMWANYIGVRPTDIFKPEDLKEVARLGYEASLRSLKWACNNYDKVWSPGQGGLATDDGFDHESPDTVWEPIDDLYRMPAHIKRERFDQWLCDVCSLALSCPYSRPGAVCIVDQAETVELATKFKSRKSSEIIDGLGALIDVNVQRLNRGMEQEIETRKIDPAVTKLIDSIFDRGVQLAKMVDPAMAGQLSSGTNVNVGIIGTGGATRVMAATPQELMAGVAKRLEADGISLENITPDDVERVLAEVPRGEVIDVQSTDDTPDT